MMGQEDTETYKDEDITQLIEFMDFLVLSVVSDYLAVSGRADEECWFTIKCIFIHQC